MVMLLFVQMKEVLTYSVFHFIVRKFRSPVGNSTNDAIKTLSLYYKQ
jgi:hypothetical protein